MALPFLFNEKWYLDHNPDVVWAVKQGMFTAQEHFELYGKTEGRAPGPLFDPDLYLVQNPDVAAAVQRGETSAYDHFVNWGIDEERAPIALFDLDFYLLQNPDVAAAVQAGQAGAVRHFLNHGQGEPRFINPFIDLGAYLRTNGDVADAVQRGDMSALEHLMLYGVHEGRDLGNGVTLDLFKNDAAFNQALAAGDEDAALQRMAAVAPFLPTFQPPANWAPAPDTPIVTDFVPPNGMKLVVPDGVVVPEGMVLPNVYEQPSVPDDQGGAPPTFTVHVASDGTPNVVTFGGSATGDIVLTINGDGDGSFSRGGGTADVTVPTVLNTKIQGSAATETLRLATALTGSQLLNFDGVGGEDKLVLADGGNVLRLAVDNVAEVKGGSGNDELRLINQAKDLVIDGGAGVNKVVFVYNSAPNAATLKNVESVQGAYYQADTITLRESMAAFEFDGQDGDDTLTLADGGNSAIKLTLKDVNEVIGGNGDDVITLVNQANGLIIDGKEGNDHLKLMAHHNGAYTVTARSIERVDGDGDDDSITLDTPMSHFAFHGGGGHDTLNLSTALGGTIELELSDIAEVTGSSNNDQITIVAGHGSTASIDAGEGNDTVTGSALHVESITLGDGNDIVVLNSKCHADQLTDFKMAGVDKIHLSLSVFAELLEQGDLNAAAFLATSGGGAAAATGELRVIYHTDTGDLYYDPDGSGLSEQVLIAQLSSKPGLDYTDFLVIA
ncbi:calcium-binding protein [Alcaligenaceae bacterium]|nr:calcium-binding protein [Alcaligenaceae bacterium]